MHRIAFLVLVVALLAGCLDGSPPAPVEDPDPVAPEPSGGDPPAVPAEPEPTPEEPTPATRPPAPPLRLACPDGSAPGPGGVDACATTFEGGLVQGEPFVAVDPADPERRALAFFERTADGTGPFPLHFHLSEDGGRTWSALPSPRPEPKLQTDPLLAFAADGGLLASGISMTTVAAGIDVWVARSDDGATWTTTYLSSDGDNDRQWLGVGTDGTLVMLWQRVDPRAVPHVSYAFSTDHGRTWETEAVLVEACNTHTEPIVGDGGFWFACSHLGDAPCRVPWYWSTLDGTVRPVGCARDGTCGTNMVARDGERLLMTCLGAGRLSTSEDGGRNWTDRGTLQDLPGATRDGRAIPFWVTSDGTGWHLVLSHFVRATPPDRALAYGIDHLVLDRDLTTVAHTVLWEGDRGLSVQKGEYMGLATGPSGGLVAWVDGSHKVRTAPLVP